MRKAVLIQFCLGLIFFQLNAQEAPTEKKELKIKTLGYVECFPTAQIGEKAPILGHGQAIFPVEKLETADVMISNLVEKSFDGSIFPEGMLKGTITVSVTGWLFLMSVPDPYLQVNIRHTLPGEDKSEPKLLSKSWQIFPYTKPTFFMNSSSGGGVDEVGVYCQFNPASENP